ncbi:unnamed protein product [Phytophthora fragariaefolia]|uniref:Unnamed protein product n=1 Tax=Phytophthora fragariaefolia TaxID=1490495 RepID=A0A9W6XBH5_9STRA|nr:unnamed protein product [Phytophthora fragariaefolia]
MDNGTTSTHSASATTATQQAASTGRTLRPRKSVVASTQQASQVKPTRGKGKKPARGSGRSRQQETQPALAGLGNSLMPRTASTESDYASVAHPIFMVTAAPKVEDISHEALTRWVDLRLEYEEIMRARCVSSGEVLKSVMRSLFQDQLVMSMNKTDIDARVMDYFHLCNTIVKTNGQTALFSEEDGTKKKCKVLLNCLPGELKTRVKNEIDFRLPAAESSVSELFKVVSEKALEIDREDKALAKNKRRPQTQETKQEMATRPPKRGRIVEEKQKSRESQLQTTQRPIFRTDSGQNQPGPKGGCWTCGGQHRKADCPEAPAGDATRTRKQKPGRHRKTKTD